MELGARITALRTAREWTQAELGVRAARAEGRPRPYTDAHINKIERGAGNPSLRCLSAIAEVLNTSVSALMAEAVSIHTPAQGSSPVMGGSFDSRGVVSFRPELLQILTRRISRTEPENVGEAHTVKLLCDGGIDGHEPGDVLHVTTSLVPKHGQLCVIARGHESAWRRWDTSTGVVRLLSANSQDSSVYAEPWIYDEARHLVIGVLSGFYRPIGGLD